MTTVKMKSLDDLVSVADGLAKPVLYVKKIPTLAEDSAHVMYIHVFYVLDGSVRYQYEITEKTETGGSQS
jgi:hypothetical protein